MAKKRSKRDVLYDKAWELHSVYIRKRDKGICITCGERKWNEELGEWTIKGMQAGHFKHNVLDFDDMNINCQCARCNHYLSGNLSVYAMRLIDKYGLKKVKDLERRASEAQKGKKLTVEELEAIIKDRQKKIHELDNGASNTSDISIPFETEYGRVESA